MKGTNELIRKLNPKLEIKIEQLKANILNMYASNKSTRIRHKIILSMGVMEQ